MREGSSEVAASTATVARMNSAPVAIDVLRVEFTIKAFLGREEVGYTAPAQG